MGPLAANACVTSHLTRPGTPKGHLQRACLLWVGWALVGCGGSDSQPPLDIPDAPPRPDAAQLEDVDCDAPLGSPPVALGLNPFYEQYLDVAGVPVVGSSTVDPAAFPIACDIMIHMLALRPDVLAELRENQIRVGIMAVSEVTTDMPEHSDLNTAFPEVDWDTRARGVGATLDRPLSSIGEENLLGLAGDPYMGESIMVHEFAHTIFVTGLVTQPGGSTLDAQLEMLYQAALTSGVFDNTYAASNRQEYYAEGAQSFYDANLSAEPADGIHNSIDTRVELYAADPGLHDFLAEIFDPDDPWRP